MTATHDPCPDCAASSRPGSRPSTGATLGLRGCGFFHIVAGQIAFQRGCWDKLMFLRLHGLQSRERNEATRCVPHLTGQQMPQDTDDKFFERADAYISWRTSRSRNHRGGQVSASMMYATSRFNAWVGACNCESAEELSRVRDEAIEYFGGPVPRDAHREPRPVHPELRRLHGAGKGGQETA